MKICKSCGKELLPANFETNSMFRRAKYCNNTCYQNDHAVKTTWISCLFCNTDFKININSSRIYCSPKCRYDAAKRDGSTYVGVNGYRYIKVHNHPNGAQSNYWMLEHRHIMEQSLGRYLTIEETVHHKDGNKLNNSLDNLEILSNSEHVKLHYAKQVQEYGYSTINSDMSILKRSSTRRHGY